MRLPLLLAGASLAVVSLAETVTADPQGRIAYTSYGTIYVTNPDGSDRTALTSGHRPAWSPDGRRIVFVGGGGISVMQSDGSDIELLLAGPGPGADPSFSPDGRRILFTWAQPGSHEHFVYVMDARPGAQPQMIPLFPSDPEDPSFHQGPAWAPDGRSIAFVHGRPSQIGTGHLGDIYVASPDGSEIRRLSDGIGQNEAPAWSPDGRTIAFYSRRDDGEGIFLVDVETRQLRLLSPSWTIDWAPSWSLDGEWIAFTSSQSRKSIDIFIMRRDGTDVRNLTEDSERADEYPAWSPTSLLPETSVEVLGWGRLKRDVTVASP